MTKLDTLLAQAGSRWDEKTGAITYEDSASKDAFDRKAEVEKIYKTKDIKTLFCVRMPN